MTLERPDATFGVSDWQTMMRFIGVGEHYVTRIGELAVFIDGLRGPNELPGRSGPAGAATAGEVEAPPSPAAALTVACPQCSELVKPQGLGSHQRKHKPGSGGEWYLCSRCPMKFPTREKRAEHLERDHEPAPRGRPVGEQPTLDYTRGGGTL